LVYIALVYIAVVYIAVVYIAVVYIALAYCALATFISSLLDVPLYIKDSLNGSLKK